MGEQAALTAHEIKDSNDLTDLANKPWKKLNAIADNIRLYQSAMDVAKTHGATVDKQKLKKLIDDLISKLNTKKAKL